MFGIARLNNLAAAISTAYSGDIVATGGDIISYYRPSTGTNYKIHTFTTNGLTFQITNAAPTATVDLLLVGGGGAGGGVAAATYLSGGGGGGGRVLFQTGNAVSITSYTITVGAGGTGVSAGAGNAGGTTSALGFSASGGGGGAGSSGIGTNGGGSGSNIGTSNVATVGTYTFKGGNGFGSVTNTQRSSGGGAGFSAAGVDAAANTGGNGGDGIQNNIDGNNYFYASGGGGSGSTTIGLAKTRTGSFISTASYGSGRSTAGVGNAVTNPLAAYGAGGGGAYTAAGTVAAIGGAGNQGIAIIRYPIASVVSSYSFVNSTSTITVNAVAPTGIQAGDVAIFIQHACNTTTTIPTQTAPAGWTVFQNTSTSVSPAVRTNAYYKICDGTESGASFTCMTGTNHTQSSIYVYRPNIPAMGVMVNVPISQTTTATPTTQTLSLTTQVGPYIGIALASSSGNVILTAASSTPTRTTGPSANFYYRTWEQTSGGSSFIDQSVSMSDTGTNTLATYVLQIF